MESNMLNTANLTRAEIQTLALDFLKGKTKDHRGRDVQDYLEFTEQDLEFDHEWVQWAFPIDTASPHNPWAGRLFFGCNAHFKVNGKAYKNQELLAKKYLGSIGFTGVDHYAYSMKCDANKFFQVVDAPDNHHMKRISRVLRHFVLSNHNRFSKQMVRAITRDLIAINPNGFTPWTVAYWNATAYNYRDVFP
jgi:hypothetical protein